MPRGLVLANIIICWAFVDTAALEARWQYCISSSGARTHPNLGSIAQQSKRRRSLDEGVNDKVGGIIEPEEVLAGVRHCAPRKKKFTKLQVTSEQYKFKQKEKTLFFYGKVCKTLEPTETNTSFACWQTLYGKDCHTNRRINTSRNTVFCKLPEPMLQVPAATPPTTLQRQPFACTHNLSSKVQRLLLIEFDDDDQHRIYSVVFITVRWSRNWTGLR